MQERYFGQKNLRVKFNGPLKVTWMEKEQAAQMTRCRSTQAVRLAQSYRSQDLFLSFSARKISKLKDTGCEAQNLEVLLQPSESISSWNHIHFAYMYGL